MASSRKAIIKAISAEITGRVAGRSQTICGGSEQSGDLYRRRDAARGSTPAGFFTLGVDFITVSGHALDMAFSLSRAGLLGFLGGEKRGGRSPEMHALAQTCQ